MGQVNHPSARRLGTYDAVEGAYKTVLQPVVGEQADEERGAGRSAHACPRQASATLQLRLWSASDCVLAGEKTVDVLFPDPVRPADTNRGKLAGLHQPVHGHIGNPEQIGYLANRDVARPWPGIVELAHVSLLHLRG